MVYLPVKVFIVDDSAFMRRVITMMLESDQDIQVIGYARDGQEALEKIQRLQPDVVTMDVEMPGLNGLETLEKIMILKPLPVVMLSAVTIKGARTTLKALELGAVDFVTKPENRSEIMQLAWELPDKVKMAAGVPAAKIRRQVKLTPAPVPAAQDVRREPLRPKDYEVVAIGTSTGGPAALTEIFKSLPAKLNSAVLIAQHMPPGFTRTLAQRLNDLGNLPVKEAKEGDLVRAGQGLLAPAGWQMELEKNAGQVRVRLSKTAPIPTLFKPSVDVLLLSVAKIFGQAGLGVILTGMGNDGARGLKALKEASGHVLAQDESSCIVYGMPKAAVEAGVVDKIVPLSKMAEEISNLVR